MAIFHHFFTRNYSQVLNTMNGRGENDQGAQNGDNKEVGRVRGSTCTASIVL